MRAAVVTLLLVVAVLACREPVAPDPCTGLPRTDEGQIWSNPRPHPDGTMWNVTFLIPPCHWRTVRDTVLVCPHVNTTRCFPAPLTIVAKPEDADP